jgi:SagB-type dehydrogenase family enzyme
LSASLRLTWRADVSLSAGDGQATVEAAGSRFSLRRPRPEIVDALRRLTAPGEDEERLSESILAAGGTTSLAKWFYCIKGLGERGLIHRCFCLGDTPLATLVPLGPAPQERNGHKTRTSATVYALSRFAYLHRNGGEMVVECPLAHSRIVLHDPRATMLVAALAKPVTIEDLASHTRDFPADAVRPFVEFLAGARMVEQTDADGPANEVPAAWEFHDLLFHSRSRRGRSDAGFGATYRLADRPHPPAVKITSGKQLYPLDRPDLDRLQRDDPPLALVQERRRSIREYGEPPITARQVGEFLYRVARVKERWQAEAVTPAGNVTIDFASRPFPAGGALYELEFYLAVRTCQGLEAGLYHYDPLGHGLARIKEKADGVAGLLDEAAASAGVDPSTLQVLVVLAARFERIAWKYESIAYALTLKHVGVAYQTMYLAATAMGLAPCALGCGDSDLFSRASGNDYYVEASVGEFLLGSRRELQ